MRGGESGVVLEGLPELEFESLSMKFFEIFQVENHGRIMSQQKSKRDERDGRGDDVSNQDQIADG